MMMMLLLLLVAMIVMRYALLIQSSSNKIQLQPLYRQGQEEDYLNKKKKEGTDALSRYS